MLLCVFAGERPLWWRHHDPHPRQAAGGRGGAPPLIHRCHGFLERLRRKTKITFFFIVAEHPIDYYSPFPELDIWTEGGLGLLIRRPWDPGSTFVSLSVNFHSVTVERWPTRRSAPSKWCADSGPWTAPRWPEATDTLPSFKGRTP